jgi:hypothetical protein
MNIADQCRERGLVVGDVIVGRTTYDDPTGVLSLEWDEAELTVLWLGQTEVVFSERKRSDVDTEWSPPRDSIGWRLEYRDWVKVTGAMVKK